MSILLQLLSVTLAMVAAGTFLMSAFLLGSTAKGWRNGHPAVRAVLHVLALFWMTAALVACHSPDAVITTVTVFAVIVFAWLGVMVLTYVVRHRPARALSRRVKR